MRSINVRCHSSHRYAERPISFTLEGVTHTVSRIEKEWLGPGKRYFTISTENSEIFELCYDEQRDEWSIT